MTPPPDSLRAVIFDLDGTLVDTADDFIPVMQQLRDEHGLPPSDPEPLRRSVSNGSAAMVTRALGLEDGSQAHESARQRLLALYRDTLGQHSRFYPGLRELLDELEARRIGWGIATNKPRSYTEPLLLKLGLEPAPDTVLCPDDVTHRKPHPESVLRICAALRCEARNAIYAGDHARDIEAGRRAGSYTVAATYGYIDRDDDPSGWGADALAADSAQLAALVRRFF